MADISKAQYCYNCACVLLQPAEEAGRTRTARMEELLRHNHPPLDVELPAFRKIAEDARATVDDWDAKILQARQLLQNLISARQRAQSHFEDAKCLLHPMRSIPNELLAEIFGHCIMKDYDEFKDPASLNPRAAPWLLTRICRRWRNLAVNLPQLWTYLWLDFDRHRGRISYDQCAYKVSLFTERSRGLPMMIYLGSEYNLGHHHPVLPVLEASLPRWRRLLVDLPRPSLQFLSGNNFSMLQTVFLNNDEEDSHLNHEVFKLASMPVLRCLRVPADRPWHALDHVAFPWSQITSVMTFPGFDVDGLDCLGTMAGLEELSVVVTSAHTPIHHVVLLSKLRRLTITESKEAQGRSKEFFSTLTMPVLSELALEYHATSVLHFPTAPLPLGNLIKLDISCEMSSHVENTQHILDFFTLTHHVEDLYLYDLNMTAEFADGLNLDKIVDGLPARLPRLRVLDIGECGFAPTVNDFVPFFAMLYSRLRAATVEAKHGAKEIGDASRNPSMDGHGQRVATRTEFGARSGLDSPDHHRCLKEVQVPRRLYVQMRRDWPDIFVEVTSMVDLKCGVTIEDMDS